MPSQPVSADDKLRQLQIAVAEARSAVSAAQVVHEYAHRDWEAARRQSILKGRQAMTSGHDLEAAKRALADAQYELSKWGPPSGTAAPPVIR